METRRDDIDPKRQIVEILLPDMGQFCLSPAPRVIFSPVVDGHVAMRDVDDVDGWSDDIDDPTGLWLLEWLARAGDEVQAGEPLAELRTELFSFANRAEHAVNGRDDSVANAGVNRSSF
jgi:hypothetical protein